MKFEIYVQRSPHDPSDGCGSEEWYGMATCLDCEGPTFHASGTYREGIIKRLKRMVKEWENPSVYLEQHTEVYDTGYASEVIQL